MEFTYHPQSMLLLLMLLLVAFELHSTDAFNTNSLQKTFKNIAETIIEPKPSGSASDAGDALLQELNLTASYDPQVFSVVDWKYLPGIVGASLPALFRLGTGALAEGYTVELVPRDKSQYTLLPLGDKYQVAEISKNASPRRRSKEQPQEPLVLWDREGKVECRWVREACSILSLTVTIRPCPDKGLQFASRLPADQLKRLPLLEDPNTGVSFVNGGETTATATTAILKYLFRTYGNGEVPLLLGGSKKDSWLPLATTTLAMGSRFGAGSRFSTSDPPPLPLKLWTYESSPFGKRVTESLGALELEHTVTYCPRGSPNRQSFLEENGRFQVPYLQDPNTGVGLWESAAICEYLTKQYGLRTPVAYF